MWSDIEYFWHRGSTSSRLNSSPLAAPAPEPDDDPPRAVPVVSGADLTAVPEELLRDLYESFNLEVRYQPDNQAVTIRVTVRQDRLPSIHTPSTGPPVPPNPQRPTTNRSGTGRPWRTHGCAGPVANQPSQHQPHLVRPPGGARGTPPAPATTDRPTPGPAPPQGRVALGDHVAADGAAGVLRDYLDTILQGLSVADEDARHFVKVLADLGGASRCRGRRQTAVSADGLRRVRAAWRGPVGPVSSACAAVPPVGPGRPRRRCW